MSNAATPAHALAHALEAAADGAAAVESVARAFAAADLHFGHGTDNASDEAAWLFAHVTGVDYADPAWRETLERALAARVGAAERARIAALAEARITRRVPLAYLIGEAWFCGLRFEVSDAVLVPRSPIGELIDNRFAPWVDGDRLRRVLEIGTGSGCIAIATALALPDVDVDATDVSDAALAVARRNVARHRVADRVRLLRADVFDGPTLGRYDLIVSNPPYVDAADMAARPAEFRHEPTLGLAAGDDGLDIVRRMLADAVAHLQPGGMLICEVGNSAQALQREYAAVPFTWLSFAHGGTGVFAITREQLEECAPAIGARVTRIE